MLKGFVVFTVIVYALASVLQHLNWAVRPAKGDVQINWRYELPNGVPYGLKSRLLAICERFVTAHKYKHVWRDGVLFRIGEVCCHSCTLTIGLQV